MQNQMIRSKWLPMVREQLADRPHVLNEDHIKIGIKDFLGVFILFKPLPVVCGTYLWQRSTPRKVLTF
jgi:hypothetical protein